MKREKVIGRCALLSCGKDLESSVVKDRYGNRFCCEGHKDVFWDSSPPKPSSETSPQSSASIQYEDTDTMDDGGLV